MTELQISSVRTPGDSWEITESVGATALGVAAARAAETAQTDPLIRDPFAYLLVCAAGPRWAELAGGSSQWYGDDEHGRTIDQMARSYQAVRTHFFDDFFGTTARAGIRQVVIVAAGLDSRAYRLDWPAGTVVFEIDQPKVLAYKGATLEAHGAIPNATRHAVAVDLRENWPAALIDAGFDPRQPTAWLAEGLLPYLPADAQDRLFEKVTALSAPDSRIAVEAFAPHASQSNEQRAAWRERTARLCRQLGLDDDLEALTYREPDRADAVQWLAEHGWQVHAVDSHDEMARLGRPVPDELAEHSVSSTLVSARLSDG
ncbi:MAG TPA: class I SAM-dependent methyltransferase [Mycobacterium sp.]|nr:class I SAM-dependent methyltransferase [Mycobacterium sp.]